MEKLQILNEVDLEQEVEEGSFMEPISSLDAEYENMEKITIIASVQYE